MRLKKSCYEPAIARMELRRFLPAWVLYSLMLLITTMFLCTDTGTEGLQRLMNMDAYMQLMVVFNAAYAFLLAQLFFGDLYTARLCNALNAMPITRGGYMGTQIILGLGSALISYAINGVLIAVLLPGYSIIGLWWFGFAMVQFLCFYGIALLCAVCAGNRFGMMMLYGIVDLFGVLLYWFQLELYTPLLYGIQLFGDSIFLRLSPLAGLINMYLNVDYEFVRDGVLNVPGMGCTDTLVIHGVNLVSHCSRYPIYALAGIAAAFAACRLFARRQMERAGDLVAFDWLKPIFLLIFTLACAAACQLVDVAFFGRGLSQGTYLLLLLGLVCGYYAGRMLLEREIHVFRKKNLPFLLGILGVMLLSIVLTGLDVFGVADRLPDIEDLQSVYIGSYYQADAKLTSEEDIRLAFALQQQALQEYKEVKAGYPLTEQIFGDKSRELRFPQEADENLRVMTLTIQYMTKEGGMASRRYYVPESSPSLPVLRELFSRPESILGNSPVSFRDEQFNIDAVLSSVQMVSIDCYHDMMNEYSGSRSIYIPEEEDIRGFMEALLADCEAGNMAQGWIFHPEGKTDDHMEIYCATEVDGVEIPYDLYLYSDCENTWNWLRANGFHE